MKLYNSMFYPYQDQLTGYWVTGSIEWIPLRLAYASTIHKSQGLSLDRVQVDSRPDFYGYPSMAYVAVSRCKTPNGLIIVGNEYDFANKVVTNREVLKWV
jgi:ATP-dependent exoDNAse (exonuclease V) alpha subunit